MSPVTPETTTASKVLGTQLIENIGHCLGPKIEKCFKRYKITLMQIYFEQNSPEIKKKLHKQMRKFKMR